MEDIEKLPDMPEPFKRELGKMCSNCVPMNSRSEVDTILWRNVREAESRYESRFRPFKSDTGTCYLQCMSICRLLVSSLLTVLVHTMQVPVLAQSNIILALIHHVHEPKKLDGKEPDEHIFAFIVGLEKEDIDKRFHIISLYQEFRQVGDISVGITT